MRAIILLAILGSALAVPRNIQRIVGGEGTTIETYPFMTNLQINWWGIIWLQGCGGSLITPVTVVTAAHCVEDDPPSWLRIIVGSTMRGGAGGDVHGVSNIVIHPEYENVTALDADVAILHLVTRTVLSNRIQTIPIVNAAAVLDTGLPVTTIGWGALNVKDVLFLKPVRLRKSFLYGFKEEEILRNITDEFVKQKTIFGAPEKSCFVPYQGQAPEILQHVHVYITDRERCAQVYDELRQRPGFSGWPKITDYMVCAGIENVGGKDGCQGDSGGPVVYRAQDANILVGITSWGYQCALPTHPGVLVNVPKFTNWIVANA